MALLCACASAACAGGPSREQVDRSQREFQLGVGLWQEQNAPAAFEHLLRAIELDPDNAEAHQVVGNLFWLVRQDYERAEHHLREALRAHGVAPGPNSLPAKIHNDLGVLFIHTRRYEDAIAELRESASDLMNHDPVMSYTNLGWAYLLAGQHDRAMEALGQAVRTSPASCVAWYRIAQVHEAREEWGRAVEALDRALDVEDEVCRANQEAWRLRGQVHARLGHRDEAVSDLERCVELSPRTSDGEICQRLLEGASAGGHEGSGEGQKPAGRAGGISPRTSHP